MMVVTSLHQGFMDVEVFALHQAIFLQVIWRDLGVMDTVFLQEVGSCCHKCWPIVCHDFSGSAPFADDLLKYAIPKGLLVLLLEWAPLRPR